jgi:general secretion pathway protein H
LKVKTKQSQSGFSLLELIIVLVIIGIIVATISISIGDTRADSLRLEARKIAARISLAINEAILTGRELGFEVAEDGYQFLVLEDSRWQIIVDGEKHLQATPLPEGVRLEIAVEGLFANFAKDKHISNLFTEADEDQQSLFGEQDAANNQPNDDDKPSATDSRRPQVYILSSGELSPFRLVLGFDDRASPNANSGNDNDIYYIIDVDFQGDVLTHGPFYEPMSLGLNKTDAEIALIYAEEQR